jgi:iron complex outermembrane recepter protein
MRLSVAAAVTCLVLTGLATAEPAAAAIRKHTSISPQSLGAALQTLAKDRSFQVLYRTEVVGDRRTAGAVGELSFDEALTKLLSGSGLTFQYLDDRTVTILPVGAPAASPMSSPAPTANDDLKQTQGAPLWSRFRLAQADTPLAAGGAARSDSDLQRVTLEEVIVTAQKRAERLQDVPVPVTAISGATLTQTNQLRLEDYYRHVPGLAVGVAGEGNAPSLSIRGITTATDANATVGIVIDDIPYGGSVVPGTGTGVTAVDIDPGEVARIEVLRGPQGTLYGASSMGGLLKYVTIDPSFERLSGRVQVGATSVSKGDDLGHTVRGSINVPVGDTLAVRASGFTLSDPGYIDNMESAERDVNERESEGGRASLLWSPSQDFTLKLSALYQQSKRLGTSDVDINFGAEAFRQEVLPGTGTYERKTEAYGATMTARLGAVELTSVTGYSVDESSSKLDYTRILGGILLVLQVEPYFPQNDRLYSDQIGTVQKFTQELRASLALGERVDWLVGAFYGDETGDFFGENTVALDSGAPVGVPFGGHNSSSFQEQAVFTTFTVDLTDRWDLQVGGRFGKFEQDAPITWTGIHAASVFGETPHTADQLRADDDAFTYLVTPRWRISEDTMVYLRLASGYRAGGPNNGCGQAADVPCQFTPDETRNYDLGAKGALLDGALSYDASLYYIDWRKIQIAGLLNSTFSFAFTDNVSKARSRGAELTVEARPFTGMALSAWLAYNEATLQADLPRGIFQAYGRVGDRLPYGPRLSGSFTVDQKFQLWNAASLSVGGSVSYVGERIGGFETAGLNPDVPLIPRERFPSYTQLDLRAGLAFDGWDLGLFVNNATDERGVLRGGNDSQFSPNYFVFTRPRSFGVTLVKEF